MLRRKKQRADLAAFWKAPGCTPGAKDEVPASPVPIADAYVGRCENIIGTEADSAAVHAWETSIRFSQCGRRSKAVGFAVSFVVQVICPVVLAE